jgi:hypothetical protein
MLPPQTYEKARKYARLHVQIELDPLGKKVEKACENFPITGKIVRVFRGQRICQVGNSVKFDVAVLNSLEVPCSGILWLHYSDLLCNRYMEAYLNGKPPKCSVAMYQYKLIEAPSEYPIFSSPSRKWWQFF